MENMKIFQLLYNPYIGNPYVRTLMDGICNIDKNVKFGYGSELFWNDEIFQYNIVHIHFPADYVSFFSKSSISSLFEQRLRELKLNGIKIIATCHNLVPHYERDNNKIQMYKITYMLADCILHLGEYSLELLKKEYPLTKHLLLYHHTYDQMYHVMERNNSVKKLSLDPSKKYLLCFGDFRANEERTMIDGIVKYFYKKGIEVLAPHYYKYSKRRNKLKMFTAWLKTKVKSFTTKGLHLYGKYVTDDMLPYFYGAADICLIQRKKILNSGNLPMAFYMGKVVVGPNVGNVGQILKNTGNPTFDPENEDSIIDAIDKALMLNEQGIGEKNKKYADENWSTAKISQQLYDIYKSIVGNA